MAERLLEPIRRLACGAGLTALSDAELLTRFAGRRDQDAFAELVRRHSGVVWRACQSVLPRADAEDAFQAAFVVLARKAGRLSGASVSGWLFRVAYRISLRSWRALRRHRPTALDRDPAARPDDGLLGWRELQAVLQAELARLPGKHRETFLLCVIEGETKPGAARRLGVPVGTVSSRLAAAREVLRARLTRRGIELPAVLAALAVARRCTRCSPAAAVTTGTDRIPAVVAAPRPAGRRVCLAPGPVRRPDSSRGGRGPAPPTRSGAAKGP